jgi:NADH dehydrogenase
MQLTIIGAGATGVELAAELRNTTRELVAHGRENINPDRDIRLTLIEAGPRILPALPPAVAAKAQRQLQEMQVGADRRAVSAVEAMPCTASGRALRRNWWSGPPGCRHRPCWPGWMDWPATG